MKIKRRIPAIILLCSLFLAFCGCNTQQSSTENEYDHINEMLNLNYSQINLTVTNEFAEDAILKSEYSMKFSDGGITVNYCVERFSSLSLDSTAPIKTKHVGEATVSDGKINYVQGDEVNLDAVTEGIGLEFKEEYFDNIDLTGVYIFADVVNPDGFFGSPLACREMKVKATFIEVLIDIKISYLTQDGNRVEYLYLFTM